ncbi:MAG: Ig-like domain-containing protein, partial [Bacteroidales bacterium]|nr:Ig-like domain-containing protein [Bacteroidales bacterium]
MKTFSKRLLTMLLSAAMVFGLSGMTAFAAEPDEQVAQDEITTLASGVEYQEYGLDFSWYEDPEEESYTISTPEQLAAFSAIVNGTTNQARQNSFAGQTVNLGGDIIMNDADDVRSEDGKWGGISTPTLYISDDAYAFTPIGNMRFNQDGSRASGYSFQGTFDGHGYSIENLYVTGDDGYLGLFGVVGGLEGEEGLGLLERFTVSGVIECDGGSDGSEKDFMGGACAKLNAGATIQCVTNNATIYGPYTDNVGGIVGFAGTPSAMGGSDNITTNPSYEENPSGYNTFVLCCANNGTVLGFHKNGGILGENAATVKYCYNTGWIMCRRNYQQVRMGGICGTNGNNGMPVEESVIAYCYNTGPVSNNGRDDQYAAAASGVRAYAGITGSNYGGSGKNEVYNCYNMGAIPEGYANYNSIASRLDDDPNGYGCGAYVAVRNNYSLDTDEIARNTASDYPQETGYWVSDANFKKTTYGDDDILTGLGPYFVADKNGKHEEPGFPILWWQDEEATLPAYTGLTIAQGPDKTTYIAGDRFDPTGMVVYAEYENGVRARISSNEGSYEGIKYDTLTGGFSYDETALTGGPQYVEITYTDGETTWSAWQPVNGAVPTINEVNITSDITGNTKTYDGEEVTLTANVDVDPAGAELTCQWYKGDDAIEGATEKEYTLAGNVSDSGTYKCVVTASYAGEQTDPATGEITITIEKAEQEIAFAQDEVAKMVGDEPFTNELSGAAEGAAITYDSSDKTVATVDENGQVTILAEGTVTITAEVSETTNYEAATASYELTIEPEKAPTINDVTITSDIEGNSKVYDGEGVSLKVSAQVEPASAEVTCQWYKDGELLEGETGDVLNLDGNVSDTGTYTCDVTATTPGGSASGEGAITITISAAAQEISFEESAITKTVGDEPFTNELIETKVDTAGGATISYDSSDKTVATVDENGQVTILAAGNATITATVSATANYAEATATYDLTVEAIPVPTVSDVTITSSSGDTKTYDGAGVSLTAAAQVTPADAEVIYQWYKDGTLLEGETGDVLNLDGNVSDTGTYTCVVTATNRGGSASGEGAITITITAAAQEISFAESAITKTVGDEPFANELIETTVDTAGGATITYTSSDETIASVDETGQVTILAEGNVTITATVSATANYAEAAASYALTIEAAPEPPIVDKSVLESAIADAESLDASKYTEESWSALEEALAAAKVVDENAYATQDEVKQAEIDLIEAVSKLEFAGGEPGPETDKTDLMEEYVKGLDLSENDYTPESWKPFADALEDALDVLLNVDATQDDVEAAMETLKTAMDNLVKSGTVKNGLCKIEAGKLWGYYVDDKVDTSYTGFAHNENGDWWVVNGYVRFDTNSVEKDTIGKNGDKGVDAKGTWWYVIGNKVQHNFTGLANYKNVNGW